MRRHINNLDQFHELTIVEEIFELELDISWIGRAFIVWNVLTQVQFENQSFKTLNLFIKYLVKAHFVRILSADE